MREAVSNQGHHDFQSWTEIPLTRLKVLQFPGFAWSTSNEEKCAICIFFSWIQAPKPAPVPKHLYWTMLSTRGSYGTEDPTVAKLGGTYKPRGLTDATDYIVGAGAGGPKGRSTLPPVLVLNGASAGRTPSIPSDSAEAASTSCPRASTNASATATEPRTRARERPSNPGRRRGLRIANGTGARMAPVQTLAVRPE
jgi:hypothetical protein